MAFKIDQKPKDELLQHWEHLLRLVFPTGADIRSIEEESGFRFCVAWRLGESDSFVENWSKEIDIVIPRETISAYRSQNEKGRSIADNNLVAMVEVKKSEFQPWHDTPRYHVPPMEEWPVTPGDLIHQHTVFSEKERP